MKTSEKRNKKQRTWIRVQAKVKDVFMTTTKKKMDLGESHHAQMGKEGNGMGTNQRTYKNKQKINEE